MMLNIIGKIFEYLMGTLLILVASFGITMILIKHYIDQTLNGQELWICILIAAGLTFMCDLEEETKKRVT